MQDPTKPATVLDPSPSHFANALQISASASPAQFLVSGESSINESRQEDRHRKSSWIRRLKPRDSLELLEGGSAEPSLEMTYSEKGNGFERMDARSRNAQPGWFLQEKAANRVSPRPNLGVEGVLDVKRQKMSGQKDLNMVEKQRSASCQEETSLAEPAKSTTSSAVALPSNAGFGPWVNFSRKADIHSESIVGSKGIVRTVATTCTQELSRDNQRKLHSACTLSNSVPRSSPVSMVGDVTAPAIFSKSPLSPVHSKIGLPPRPPSQKSSGFHPPIKVPSASGMGRGGFKQFAQGAQPNRQVFETACNTESKHAAGVQDKQTNELTESAVARCGSFFRRSNPAEQNFIDSVRDHGKGSSEYGQQLFAVASMGNSNSLVRQARSVVAERANTHVAVGQPLGCFNNGAAVEYEDNTRGICEDLHLDVPREGASRPTCTNVPPDGMDLRMPVLTPGMENPKSVLKNGITNSEPIKASMQSPSGSSHGTSTCEKADASVSTSASLPWEMFIESAGASRIAREQFVETYNRARDELKNQRMSQRMGRARAKEADVGPKLTLGPGDTASDHKLRTQSLKHEQHVAGYPQTQGRLSSNPEHRSVAAASNLKEQDLIGHAESKGPEPTFANDRQTRLVRDNDVTSKFETPWKQGYDSRLEQGLPERQSRSNVNNVLQKGEQQDNGQVFPIASAAKSRERASSKCCEGNDLAQQVARLSHQLEPASAVGKSSSDYSIAAASERGVGSGVKPPNRPHVWLQRWHPTGVYNFKGLPDTQGVPSDDKRSDSGALGLKKFKDGDGVGIFGRSRELKNTSADKEMGIKSLKSSPSKVVPSAAAMAIVGTAARQYCATQPQRKGSFAFWSGFGMPPPRKVEPVVQEKGKAKMFAKEDVDMTNC